ncbi:TonB-dependent receptor [Pedobacter frigoris]|uniref:SusC/RagA family TonB-linked outer membrane protein n=1 Tax=Pedobacter frigoris TaxID=2571272 RepID=UPI002930332B|nr:TonB-dependent receptor [Pedobacter frigoris]
MMKRYLRKVMVGKLRRRLLLLQFIGFSLVPITALAQNNQKAKKIQKEEMIPGTVKGVISDIYGEPLFGVNILNKSKNESTTTDRNGKYTIYAETGETVVVTLNGYLTREIEASGQNLDLSLTESTQTEKTYNTLYGPRKKSTSIQSYADVYSRELAQSPTVSYLNALTGRLPGLTTLQANGEPGNDFVGASIRGVAPQVLVNGIPRSFASIDPEQIESITILKDALSTVMLGQRSSGGVILIKTKQGEVGKQKVSFTAQRGIQSSTRMPKTLDAYNYATLFNEALRNDSKAEIYTAADLQAYKDGSDPVGHPNVDWYDEILKPSSPFTRYNLNTSGGGNNARYFVSVDYMNQDGLYKTSDDNSYNTNVNYKRYLLRSNIDVDITKNLVVNLNLFGAIENGNYPGGSNLYGALASTPNNAYPLFNRNGSLGGNNDFQNNIWGLSTRSGYTLSYDRTISADISLKRTLDDVIKGLFVKATLSFNTGLGDATNRTKTFAVYKETPNLTGGYDYQKFKVDGVQNAGSSTNTAQTKNLYTEFQMGYDRSFGKHNLNALVNGNIQNMYINGPNLPLDYKTLAGSFSYNYDEKYMLEVAMSYSGLNRYIDNQRYGYFPAAGVAWNISKEDFIKDNVSWINNLKLRASYGKTGNANIGYFVYDQYYVDGVGYYFGTSATFAYTKTESALANPNATWEKAKKLNIGLDADFFNNTFNITVDYYKNRFYDLMQQRGKSSAIIGNTYPLENIGITDYRGLDLQATYRNHVNNLNYFVSAIISSGSNKIVYQDEVYREYNWMQRTGQSSSQTFGYIADGFFQSAAEINASPKIAGYNPVPGDIKYKDLNGDNVINQFDITSLRSNKPMVYYSLNFGVNYKGFDFSALLQGARNRTIYLSGATEWEFQNNGLGQAFEHHLDRWTPATAATATYPRLTVGSNVNNQASSSFWLQNGNYLRLKNVEVGYTLPGRLSNKVGLSSIRVFANGLNLFTQSELDRVDPETIGSIYPAQRVVNMGINIKF